MELVETQVSDGHAAVHILQVPYFGLEPLELGLTVLQVALLLREEQVVIAGGDYDKGFHTGPHTGVQVDVVIQLQLRLVGFVVPAVDAVNAAKTMDKTYWIPVDVIINAIIAVLEVLTLRDTVGGVILLCPSGTGLLTIEIRETIPNFV